MAAESKIENKSKELKKYGGNLSALLIILLILTILALPIKDWVFTLNNILGQTENEKCLFAALVISVIFITACLLENIKAVRLTKHEIYANAETGVSMFKEGKANLSKALYDIYKSSYCKLPPAIEEMKFDGDTLTGEYTYEKGNKVADWVVSHIFLFADGEQYKDCREELDMQSRRDIKKTKFVSGALGLALLTLVILVVLFFLAVFKHPAFVNKMYIGWFILPAFLSLFPIIPLYFILSRSTYEYYQLDAWNTYKHILMNTNITEVSRSAAEIDLKNTVELKLRHSFFAFCDKWKQGWAKRECAIMTARLPHNAVKFISDETRKIGSKVALIENHPDRRIA